MSQKNKLPQLKHLVASVPDNNKRVLRLCLDRPKVLNSFNVDLYEDLIAALAYADNNRDILVVVLTGSGRAYSAGNDLGNFASIDISNPEAVKVALTHAKDLMTRFVCSFIHFKKILICAVNGPAIGIAVTTLALADFVYASESATFNTPFMTLAQSPEGCSSMLFRENMGIKANELLILGKTWTAREAAQNGLINEVFGNDEFEQRVAEIAERISRLPPQALLKTKRLLRNEERLAQLDAANGREADLLIERWASKECMQAIQAFFMRKRKADSKL